MNAYQADVVPYGTAPRVPPANLAAEQALLGALLVNNDAFYAVSGFLLPKHFYEPLHQAIFEVICTAIGRGRKADPKMLNRSFPAALAGTDITASEYVARLCSEATTVVNAGDYGREIFEAALERDLIAVGNRILDGAGNGFAGQTVQEQIAAAEDGLAEIRKAIVSTEDNGTDLKSATAALLQNIDDIRAGKSAPVPSTGLEDVDRQIGGGLRPGRLFVIAARPGMGKTVVEAALARRGGNKGIGSAIFSLEIDAAEMTARLIASHLAMTDMALDYRDILVGNLDDRKAAYVRQGAKTIATLPIEIDHSPGLSMAEIEARARVIRERFRRRGVPFGAIYIDYLQLVRPAERYRGRRVDEVGEIALGAKELSKRLECAVILFSQLSREVEKRNDKRPILSDLRDSGNIEEHADVVAFLYREAYYLQNDPDYLRGDGSKVDRMETVKHDLEFIIGKNRLGPTRTVDLWADVARAAVDNKQRW